jgi:CRP-like cAMP-binding protein
MTRHPVGGYERAVLFLYLRRAPIFSRCTDEQLEEVESCSRFEQRLAGDELVRQGQPGNEFFVVMTGKAEVLRGDQQIAVLGEGDVFGELALFDPAPRNATVRAAEPVSLVVIGREPFHVLLGRSAAIRDEILRGMAHRIHELDAKI